MAAGADLPRVEIRSTQALRDWLAANHASSGSVWLVTWKKSAAKAAAQEAPGDAGCGAEYLPYDAIVEELLAYGWVDSLPRKLDAARSMLLASPRRPGSAWSAANKARIARLEADERLMPAGRAAVLRAQADGSWSFLDAVEALEIPPDLADALAAAPPAAVEFAAFPRSARRGILEWIAQAKRPETRVARIAETARLAQTGARANQYRPRPRP